MGIVYIPLPPPYRVINTVVTKTEESSVITYHITNVDAILDAIDYIYETNDCSKHILNITYANGSASLATLIKDEDNCEVIASDFIDSGIYYIFGVFDDGILQYKFDKTQTLFTRDDLDADGGLTITVDS